MTKDFSQVMSAQTDQQLIEIVTLRREEYQHEALLAAEQEIRLRKIDPESENVREVIGAVSEALQASKENLSFSWCHKVLTVTMPLIIVAVITYTGNSAGFKISCGAGFVLIILAHRYIHGRLKEGGYTKMAAEFSAWGYYTVYIYIILLIVVGLGIMLIGT